MGWTANQMLINAIDGFFGRLRSAKEAGKQKNKRINITSGELLNEILTAKLPDETFIPFNEAMSTGTYSAKLFSHEFIAERAKVHGVTEEDYCGKMAAFLELLDNPNAYSEIVMWFGDEPFCRSNREAVLEALRIYGYQGTVQLNIVNEEIGEILKTDKIR